MNCAIMTDDLMSYSHMGMQKRKQNIGSENAFENGKIRKISLFFMLTFGNDMLMIFLIR